jgi:hypothetical protein
MLLRGSPHRLGVAARAPPARQYRWTHHRTRGVNTHFLETLADAPGSPFEELGLAPHAEVRAGRLGPSASATIWH